jgi:pimeloyl-ACP methyl ester carboxylesterase
MVSRIVFLSMMAVSAGLVPDMDDSRRAVTAQEVSDGLYAGINGMRMYYEIRGEGEPLVLLHGFSGSGTAWEEFAEELSQNYQLIIPDLRGHGQSTNPSGEFTHRQSARDVFALLDELKIETFRGMGISTGGMTLIHMATQQPERAEAMVLIGATIYFPEQAREIMRRTSVEGLSERQWEAHRRRHHHGDDQIRALINQFHRFKDSYDDMNFTPPFLGTIRARTFVVHGDRDEFFPVSIPIEMYRHIPSSYLWIVPNGGHVPIHGKNHAPFVEKSLEFLRGAWEETNRPR